MIKQHTQIYLVVSVFILLWLAIGLFSATQQMPVFSKQVMLESTWHHYKQEYLEPNTYRALDKQRDNITTSEGQSYTLLRAVWMDDKPIFDASWQWTKDNLQRQDDHLISWLFGERADGTYGVLTEAGGENTATDADVDIALALLFASKRWNDNAYFGDAILIIRDIWEHEVMMIQGKPYLLANNLEKTHPKTTAVMNPSYLSPYAYRIFAEVDPEHDWLGLVDTSYEVIEVSSRGTLDHGKSASLPPDWIEIDKLTGEITPPPPETGLTTNYSYDALRTPWRLALDAAWFNEPRAYAALDRLSFLSEEWRKHPELATNYTHAGEVVARDETHAIYGGAIGYFMFADPDQAEDLYMNSLESLYNSTTFTWDKPLGYYDANWVWFGLALYNGQTLNLYSTQTTAYEKTNLTLNLLSRLQRGGKH